jgi:glycosyltransferase involved in cell wall biosynthesis
VKLRQEGSLLAGLEAASGAAVITIDADLQHPPSLIPDMLAQWRLGARIVHGVKRNRGDEPWLSAARARLVNALVSRLGGIDIRNASDFKLLDRAALEVLTRRLPESRRFYRGLTNWIRFPQAVLEFDVAPRTTGASAWRIRSLVALTLTALVSFTSAPLRVVSVLGVLTLLLALGVGVDAIWSWLKGDAVSGFATIILTLLLIGSFIMISLGIIGEYIAKIYDEIKGRPAYILDRVHGVDTVHGLQPGRGDTALRGGDVTVIDAAAD